MTSSWLRQRTRAEERWEEEFDGAVAATAARRLRDAMSRIHRLRAWQHRQTEYGPTNHSWHDAELAWLEGVLLFRARRTKESAHAWARLAAVFKRAGGLEGFYLPQCARCAARVLPFAPSFLSVARALRPCHHDPIALQEGFRAMMADAPAGNPAHRITTRCS
jgi:hypothetical protein